MTKKDYVAIAQIVRLTTSFEIANYIVKSKFIRALCQRFEADNPRFNPEKFKKACNCPTMDKIDTQ